MADWRSCGASTPRVPPSPSSTSFPNGASFLGNFPPFPRNIGPIRKISSKISFTSFMWADIEVCCRNYLEWLKGELKVASLEDWHRVTANDFHSNYGISPLTSIFIKYILILSYFTPLYPIFAPISPSYNSQLPLPFVQDPLHTVLFSFLFIIPLFTLAFI